MKRGRVMIEGIGIDLMEIGRIQDSVERQKRFPERILTANERKTYETLKGLRKIEFLAGRFAAKEAYAKAAGTGIGGQVSFQDIEVSTDHLGKPAMKVSGVAARIHVSISHTEHYAVAQVVIENLSSSSG